MKYERNRRLEKLLDYARGYGYEPVELADGLEYRVELADGRTLILGNGVYESVWARLVTAGNEKTITQKLTREILASSAIT